MDKIRSWFTTGSGLTLIALFIMGGLQIIQSHFTGNVAAYIGTAISIIGLITHPTTMVAGRSVPSRG